MYVLVEFNEGGSPDSGLTSVRIHDCYIDVTVSPFPQTDTAKSREDLRTSTLPDIFNSSDGRVKAWSGGIAESPLDIHRDILQTDLGVVAGDIDVAGTWTDILAQRSAANWSQAFSIRRETTGRKLLNKVAKQGAFFWWIRQGKFVYDYIEDSY